MASLHIYIYIYDVVGILDQDPSSISEVQDQCHREYTEYSHYRMTHLQHRDKILQQRSVAFENATAEMAKFNASHSLVAESMRVLQKFV